MAYLCNTFRPRGLGWGLALACASTAFATPQIVRIDASIFDAQGLPASGSRDIRVKAYDAVSGGTLLWTSTTFNVPVVLGRFTLHLDAASGTPTLSERIAAQAAAQALYFEIEVDSGATNGSMDTPIPVLPRVRAKGSVFALAAVRADSISGVTATTAQLNYLSGLTANVQSQIAALGGTGGLLRASQITSSALPLPTSGNLAGTYLHLGSVTSTGNYTVASGTRIYLKGDLVIGHNFTLSGVTVGGQSTIPDYGNAQDGGGPSGGQVSRAYPAGSGGGGGGFGGSGGHGGGYQDGAWGWGGRAVVWGSAWMGSGGGSGYGYSLGDDPGDGGNAGGTVYIECSGSVTIQGSSTMAANGGAGVAAAPGGSYVGGGGGGSGGGVMIRAGGAITLASGSSITAHGGAGGAGYSYGGGGGGGGGGVIALWGGGTVTVSGTLSANGGAKGSGGGSHEAEATAGLTGVTQAISATPPIGFY